MVKCVTLVLIGVIIYFSRHELLHAWELLGRVNIWILLLLIPGQILVYYAGGEMIFSYLRAKKSIDDVPPWALARMSLEMNFVNHVLPSGGVSGVSYMTGDWVNTVFRQGGQPWRRWCGLPWDLRRLLRYYW